MPPSPDTSRTVDAALSCGERKDFGRKERREKERLDELVCALRRLFASAFFRPRNFSTSFGDQSLRERKRARKTQKKKVRRTSTVPRTLFPRPLAPLYVPLVFYVAPKRRIDRKLGVPWCFFVKRNVNSCSPRSRDEILICTTNHALIVNERSNRARELAPRSRIADFPPATRVSPALTAFPFIPPAQHPRPPVPKSAFT